MITTATFNRAYGWSGDPNCVLYRSDNVVNGTEAKRMPGWLSPRSTASQWLCGYPARCRSVVLGNVAHLEPGSRNLPIKSWVARRPPRLPAADHGRAVMISG